MVSWAVAAFHQHRSKKSAAGRHLHDKLLALTRSSGASFQRQRRYSESGTTGLSAALKNVVAGNG
jgi:hypothetical protein